jgi:hypothetical protein
MIATKIDADGVIQDSVTGQTHFVDQGVSGYQQQNTSSGLGSSGLGAGATGAGLGAGAAGLASHQQGQGHGLTDKLKQSTGTSHTEGGPISELKQELEEHKCTYLLHLGFLYGSLLVLVARFTSWPRS